MGQMLCSPVAVITASAAAQTSIEPCVASINRFRSTASATTPPTSEQKMMGRMRTSPTPPNANGDFVSR